MTRATGNNQIGNRVEYLGFDHVHFWVGNSFQAAAYYISRFGFEPYAYRGLETGSRKVMTQVVRQNNIVFAFSSPLEPGNTEFHRHLMRHGDGVKDVAFRVTDCFTLFENAVRAGAVAIKPPKVEETAEGICITATIQAFDSDTWHTFVERTKYRGPFLPGFKRFEESDPQVNLTRPPELQFIDHCVFNQPEGCMEKVVNWYVNTLGFHRFWSVDDKQIHTEYSSLRSVVVSDFHERVKIPVNEPAEGRRKSQIQEFVEYYDGPGIQHIALNTSDIATSVATLRQRGVSFIRVPVTYYEEKKQLLGLSTTSIREALDDLQSKGILLDFDDVGYLLQIFTKPLQDRPTFFIEIIQRNLHSGFGVGNFKSLFQAIEQEQALRGNL
ncbi:4-hydroxyphenylpyruvate dioxygenase [Gracilariopsis chorda]|uniref:4-hydroxyphenylpyruvate dioxygenase n=1 Tax=Gracilariopsis chorda TaxID=448386 RepID=A0A2V3IRF8_9FLOR|nr:4-hydroxyphenylpyruvate dioxygenase [Gracilariopsis chorda]|eukprot:PXF44683.1 4-hydroxyphenylpyruvate dioxygenase [Gracilariopsis chorda]